MEVFPYTSSDGFVLRFSREHRRKADVIAGTYGDTAAECVNGRQISKAYARNHHEIEPLSRNRDSTLKTNAIGIEEAGRDDLNFQIAATQRIVSADVLAVAL
jgi:hypothetical protein